MKHLAVLIAGLAFSSGALEAQGSPSSIPDSHRPPPGMCRIWIDGVPPAHQPAPTDCATAIRKRPMNARVVFGNEPAGAERAFAPTHQTPAPAPTPTPTPAAVPSAQPTHEDVDRAAQQRDEQLERERAAEQRAQEEKRARRANPPPHDVHPNNPPPSHPRTEKSPSRPPGHSFSAHRPR